MSVNINWSYTREKCLCLLVCFNYSKFFLSIDSINLFSMWFNFLSFTFISFYFFNFSFFFFAYFTMQIHLFYSCNFHCKLSFWDYFLFAIFILSASFWNYFFCCNFYYESIILVLFSFHHYYYVHVILKRLVFYVFITWLLLF